MRSSRYDQCHARTELLREGAQAAAGSVERLAENSHRLRREREFSLYGDDNFIPTEEYGRDDAARALGDAQFVVSLLDAFPQ